MGTWVSTDKVKGPATRLTFLGIEFDTMAMEVRLPQRKLRQLVVLVQRWSGNKVCTKRHLLALVGHLQHACKVVRYGRTFLGRVIQLASAAKKLHHHLRLNKGFRSDLQWWREFLPKWNGVSLITSSCHQPPSVVLTSDASGGCGAFLSSGQWFQCQWPATWGTVHITVKELLPIVLACALWGHEWHGNSVHC